MRTGERRVLRLMRRNKLGNRVLDCEFSQEYKLLLDSELRTLVNKLNAPPIIKESMVYSLEAGGKRIRPLLLFATLDAFG